MAEETNDNISFEEMLSSSLDKKDDFIEGDRVSGVIAFISKDTVFVDINGKSEAIIPIEEFLEKGELSDIKVGDQVDAYIVSIKGGEILLTTSLGKGQLNTDIILTAYESGIPVSGSVSDVTKGGYVITVSGIRCFCPFSQIDTRSPDDPASLVNNSFEFKIIQFENNGKNIVLSRRALLEEKKQEDEARLRETLSVNDIVSGEITQIKPFGLFVNIDGVDALIPRSEISWSRTNDTSGFAVGQSIRASVKQLDWANMKITLSIKDMQPDPWTTVDTLSEGDTINGRVVNIIKSGAFVEIKPGLEGFVPISKMSYTKKVNKVEDVVQRGDSVSCKIININPKEKRISLELLTEEQDPWLVPETGLVDTIRKGTIENSTNRGISVRLTNGMLGFVPRNQLVIQSNSDIQKEYTAGKEITVMVQSVNKEDKKALFSETAALKQEELKDYQKYKEKDAPDNGSSLGALFRDTFQEIRDKIKDND